MEADIYGLIGKIEHGSTNDGPGFRSVVYFSGCPLSCQWCHNPELIPHRPQIMCFQHKCVSCRQCLSVCPEVFSWTESHLEIKRENCTLCGNCVTKCLGEALQLSAKTVTAHEVFTELSADKAFYKYSDGGVTFTGGECLTQHKFLKELLKMCHQEGIHTCVESCLQIPFAVLQDLMPMIDHFFVDIKLMDAKKHAEYTGLSNKQILENIRKLSQSGKSITFRTPLIPGVNDDFENLKDTITFIHSLSGLADKELELLRYNDLAMSKYQSIGKNFVRFGSPQPKSSIQTLAHTLDMLFEDTHVFYRN